MSDWPSVRAFLATGVVIILDVVSKKGLGLRGLRN